MSPVRSPWACMLAVHSDPGIDGSACAVLFPASAPVIRLTHVPVSSSPSSVCPPLPLPDGLCSVLQPPDVDAVSLHWGAHPEPVRAPKEGLHPGCYAGKNPSRSAHVALATVIIVMHTGLGVSWAVPLGLQGTSDGRCACPSSRNYAEPLISSPSLILPTLLRSPPVSCPQSLLLRALNSICLALLQGDLHARLHCCYLSCPDPCFEQLLPCKPCEALLNLFDVPARPPSRSLTNMHVPIRTAAAGIQEHPLRPHPRREQ